MQSAARAVWDYVGYDYLELSDGRSIKRDEVIEVVCDAGRLEDELKKIGQRRVRSAVGESSAQVIAGQFSALIKKVTAAGIDIYDIVRPGFTFARYGL